MTFVQNPPLPLVLMDGAGFDCSYLAVLSGYIVPLRTTWIAASSSCIKNHQLPVPIPKKPLVPVESAECGYQHHLNWRCRLLA
jgi:hypothetical protein